MSSANGSSKSSTSASYNSPTGKHTFNYTQSALGSQASASDTAKYLGDLRKTLSQMQPEINTFLTQKMEEDKRTAVNSSLISGSLNEDKEEDNYGEEAEDDI